MSKVAGYYSGNQLLESVKFLRRIILMSYIGLRKYTVFLFWNIIGLCLVLGRAYRI